MKDFKRLLRVIVLLSSFALVSNAEENKFYVGAQLGQNTLSVDTYSNDNGNIVEMTSGKEGIIYGVNFGWRYFVDKGFHGVEASFRDTNTEGTYTMGSLGGSFQINESYEIDYKGGYEVADKTYFTGRIGLGVVKVSHSISGSTFIQNGTFDHSVNTLVTGLGFEHYLTDNITVGTEYVYRYGLEDIKYRHMYLNNSGNYTDIEGDFTDHSFMVFFNYFF